MTVSALVTRNDITAQDSGGSAQTSFTYTFRVLASTDMAVYKNGTLLTSGYTVNNVGTVTGGTVDISGGVTAGQVVSLVLDMPLTRTTDYQNSGDFLASDVNSDFDKMYIGAVQNENTIDRSIHMKDVDVPHYISSVAQPMELPLKADRANKLLSFDSNGLPAAVTSATALALIYSGTGSPNTVLTAPVGSLFLRTDGGTNTTLYVKESTSGNTGWVAK